MQINNKLMPNKYKKEGFFEIIGDGTINSEVNFPGIISGSGGNIRFTVIVDKSLEKVNQFELAVFKANIRLTSGGYLGSYNPEGTDYINGGNIESYTVTKISDNILNIRISFIDNYDVVNNTPIMVGVQNIKINFI
jgi:hypothetical protein